MIRICDVGYGVRRQGRGWRMISELRGHANIKKQNDQFTKEASILLRFSSFYLYISDFTCFVQSAESDHRAPTIYGFVTTIATQYRANVRFMPL